MSYAHNFFRQNILGKNTMKITRFYGTLQAADTRLHVCMPATLLHDWLVSPIAYTLTHSPAAVKRR